MKKEKTTNTWKEKTHSLSLRDAADILLQVNAFQQWATNIYKKKRRIPLSDWNECNDEMAKAAGNDLIALGIVKIQPKYKQLYIPWTDNHYYPDQTLEAFRNALMENILSKETQTAEGQQILEEVLASNRNTDKQYVKTKG